MLVLERMTTERMAGLVDLFGGVVFAVCIMEAWKCVMDYVLYI